MLLSFSPNTLSSEILEKTLVGRKETLDQIEQELLEKILNGQTYQSLMIAPRGSGKTHLTTALRYRLKRNPAVEDKVLVAYMNEDERGIANFSDFIRHILESFVKHQEGDFEKINDKIYEVSSLSFNNQEAAFKKILLDYIGKKGLVILIENLNILFDDKTGMGSEGQRKFRSLMHENNQFSLITTSQNLFHQIQDDKAPFYGFFKIRHLEKLNFEETLQFIKIQAELENDEELEKEVETAQFKGKVRAIYQLTGGSHRLLVIFFNFLKAEIKSDLSEVFRKTMNDLKPYYEQFLNTLSPQQQKIIGFISRNHTPQMGKDISRFCFIAPNTLSKQMSKLEEKGYLDKNKVGKDNYYELKEPLMRICFEINDRKDGIIKLFVDFLSNYYTSEELQKGYLEKRFYSINHEDLFLREKYINETRLYRGALSEKIANRLDEVSLDECSNLEALQNIITTVLPELNVGMGVSEESSHYLNEKEFKDRHNMSIQEFKDLIRKSLNLTIEQKQKFFEKNPQLSPKQINKLINVFQAEEQRFTELMGVNLYSRIIESSSLDLYSLRYDVKFLEELLLESQLANDSLALNYTSGVLILKNQFEKAIDYLDRAIKIDSTNSKIYHNKGLAHYKLKEYHCAIESFEKAIELDPQNAQFYSDLGSAYGHLDNFPRAITFFEKAIELNPKNAIIHFNQGLAYYFSNANKKALKSFEKAIELNSDNPNYYYFFGLVHKRLDNYQLAIKDFERAIKLNHEDSNFYNQLGITYLEMNKPPKARDIFQKGLLLDENNWLLNGSIIQAYLEIKEYKKSKIQFEKVCEFPNTDDEPFYIILEQDVLPPLIKKTDLKIVAGYFEFILDKLQQKQLLPELWKAFPNAIFNLLINIEDYSEAHLEDLFDVLKKEFSCFKEMTIPLLYLDIGIRYLKKGDKRAIYDFSTEERQIFEEAVLEKRKSS